MYFDNIGIITVTSFLQDFKVSHQVNLEVLLLLSGAWVK